MFVKRAVLVCLVIYVNSAHNSEEVEGQTVHVEGKKKIFLTCQDVNITCKADFLIESVNSVSWLLNGTNFTHFGDRINKTVRDCKPKSCAILHITCVDIADAGNYSCRVESDEVAVVSSIDSYRLDVHDPVKLVNATQDQRIRVGPNAATNLTCLFRGRNISNITWNKKDDQGLEDIRLPASYHEEKQIDQDHTQSVLHVRNINHEKNGTYVCSASDGVVTVSEEVTLFVEEVPRLVLHTVTVTGARTVFMNWTLFDGNLPVQYRISFRKNVTGANNDWEYSNEAIDGRNNSCILRNLNPSTTYTFRITPKNAIGEGNFAETAPLTTLDSDPHFVPEVSIKSVGPSSINIGWTFPPVELKNHFHFFKLLMFNNEVKKETVVNPDQYFSYAFTDLHSASTYNFQVAACNEYTNECGNWSKPQSGTTLDGVAGAPENVTVNCKYDSVSNTGTVQIAWLPPKNPNGEILHYTAAIQGSASFVNELGELSSFTYGPKAKTLKNDTYTAYFHNLSPNTNYTVAVSAVTRSRDSGEVAQCHCMMPPTIPDRENLLKFDWDKVEEKGQYMFKLLKPKLSERNGAICCFRVFVVKLKPQESVQQLPSPEKTPIFSYEYVHHESDGGAYIADIFDKDSINREILVGDEQVANNSKCNKCPVSVKKEQMRLPMTMITTTTTPLTSASLNLTVRESTTPVSEPAYSHYSSAKLIADTNIMSAANYEGTNDTVMPYDGPLYTDSNYTGFIQLIVFGKDDFIPAYSSYFRILQPGPQPLEAMQATEFAAILFQILCGMIAISIMMMAAFCLLQHYTKQVAEAQGVEMTLRNSFRHLCRSLRGSHVPVSSNPPDQLPVSKTALLTTFAELAKDSDYGFEQEFEMLPDRFPDRTTKASEARENQSKNRYPDIKAYDQTRVKLSQTDGILGSDYINANFVMSYKERKKFICAQGPMENTVCDFWRMIWEQHLQLVLMLTNLEEYSKTKCAKYWPDKEEEKKTYNDITIQYVTEKRYSDYVVRELKMMRSTGQNRDPEERSIFQYHFLMWKDFQAPEHPSGILKFIWRINEAYSLEKGPILVHCSAGVGRTGTLVAIDSLLQQLDNEGQVLIFNTICDLRHQRNFLVQSLKQYIFVYRALVEYAHFGNTEIKASNLKSAVEKLKRTDNGKLKTRLEEEYEKLTFTVNSHDHKSLSVGSAPENGVKNRCSTIIPYDKNRVILTPIPGREHSTYINASFIEGYDNTESFVITQDPILETTVVDFWRMVSELNISTIVMLSSTPNDGQKKTGRYWPDDETVHGSVNVKHIQSESCPYYTRREFYLTNIKSDENLVVTQYQYNGWPTVEGEVPEVTRGLIELMDHATQNVNSNGSSPMLVHCEYGGDRSSMFVALCILAQQLRIERRVDVVTTARKLRSQRQGMLTSFAQYEFLYRAILNYVDLHHLFEVESNN